MSQKINIKLKSNKRLQQEAISFKGLFSRLSSLFSRREQANVEYMKNSDQVFNRMKAISDQKTSQRIRGSIAATRGKILDSKKKKFNEQLDAASSILKQFNDSIKQGKFEELNNLKRQFETAKTTLKAVGTGSAVETEFDTMIKPVMNQYDAIMNEMIGILTNSETVLKTRDPAEIFKNHFKGAASLSSDQNVKQLFIELSSKFLILPKIEATKGQLGKLSEQQTALFPEIINKEDFKHVRPFDQKLKSLKLLQFYPTVEKLFQASGVSTEKFTANIIKNFPESKGIYEFVLFILEYKKLISSINPQIKFTNQFEELYKLAETANEKFYKPNLVAQKSTTQPST